MFPLWYNSTNSGICCCALCCLSPSLCLTLQIFYGKAFRKWRTCNFESDGRAHCQNINTSLTCVSVDQPAAIAKRNTAGVPVHQRNRKQ